MALGYEDRGWVLHILDQCSFLHGSFYRKLKKRALQGDSLELALRFINKSGGRLSIKLEVEWADCWHLDHKYVSNYAAQAFGMNEAEANRWRGYCLWKMTDWWDGVNFKEGAFKEMDEKYAYLYPDSEVH